MDPVRVEVPSAGISSALVGLTLEGGMLPAPDGFDVAGWWTQGVRPGEVGPAVLVGHVDSKKGPAVFYQLEELDVGDDVVVVRSDSSEVRFQVTRVLEADKDEFPTQEVYGPTPARELRLITCSGAFDRSVGHYEENLVVFARVA